MKTLFIVAGAPYPPRSGSPLRAWQNINVLATRGPVHVISVGYREPGDYRMPVAAEWEHFDVAEFPAEAGVRSRLAKITAERQFPVPSVLANAALNARLRATIRRFAPDLIVLSHWKTAYPDALKEHDNVVLDMHNIESLLGTDLRAVRPAWWRALKLRRWRARERDLVRRARRTWVCGENDLRRLAQLGPELPAPVVWPNGIDVERYAPVRSARTALRRAPPDTAPTLIYVGLFTYRPNADAAAALIDNIFPLVAGHLPDARLLLVGGGPNAGMMEAARRDARIVVTGQVDDVGEYLARSDVCVVPLRSGGGTRLKILECFAAGVPVVSTSVGAEGIDALPGRDIRLADDDDELARAAVELLRDPQARTNQAADALRLVETAYSWSSLERRLGDALPPLGQLASPAPQRVPGRAYR